MIIREAIIYGGSSDPVLSRPPDSRPDDPFGYDGSIDDIVSPELHYSPKSVAGHEVCVYRIWGIWM
jgi:hypothetical protein